VLRHLRDKEREAVLTIPPAARIAAARMEPTTINNTMSRKEARIAVRIFDRLVHGNDPPKTHGFDLLVRELFTDKAGDVGVGLHEPHTIRLGTDIAGHAIIILEERTLEDDDLVRTSSGGSKFFRTKHALGVGSYPISFFFRPINPPLTACWLVEGDGKVDDTIDFTPAFDGILEDDQFAPKEAFGRFLATELIDDRLKPILRLLYSFRLIASFFPSLIDLEL